MILNVNRTGFNRNVIVKSGKHKH